MMVPVRFTVRALMFVLSACWFTTTAAAETFVYAGLLSNHIEIYSADARSGALKKVSTQETSDVPFFLTIHPSKKYLYVGIKGKTNGIEAYSINAKTGRLTLINKVVLEAGPVYMGIDRTGRHLFTAPWSADKVSLSRLAEDGRLVDVNYFPTGKRPHAFAIDPSNRFLYVPCLASDIIQQYRFDAATGGVIQADPFLAKTEAGAGPRLPVFHPSLQVMYQGNEKNDTISAYKIDPASGGLNRFQTITTLPAGFTDRSNLSELHLGPNGRFLYIANRGHNSIARYQVDQKQGTLQLLGFTSVPNATVRSFSINSTGEYLYAADQQAGDLIVFSIDQTTGNLTQASVSKAAAGIGIVISDRF